MTVETVKAMSDKLIHKFCSCDMMNGYYCGHKQIEDEMYRAYVRGRAETEILGRANELDECGADLGSCKEPPVITISYRTAEWALSMIGLCPTHLAHLDPIIHSIKKEWESK